MQVSCNVMFTVTGTKPASMQLDEYLNDHFYRARSSKFIVLDQQDGFCDFILRAGEHYECTCMN